MYSHVALILRPTCFTSCWYNTSCQYAPLLNLRRYFRFKADWLAALCCADSYLVHYFLWEYHCFVHSLLQEHRIVRETRVLCKYICVNIYIYIYIYIHTHTHRHKHTRVGQKISLQFLLFSAQKEPFRFSFTANPVFFQIVPATYALYPGRTFSVPH